MKRRAIVLCCLLAGCVVGPDYTRPTISPESGYTRSAVEIAGAGPADPEQRLAIGEKVAAQWWQLFQSRDLDETVRLALAASPTMASARANLAQANYVLAAARATYLPAVDVDAQVSRDRINGEPVAATPTVFSVGPVVTYGPDLFGRTRRIVEQQSALAEFQFNELGAAYLSVAGNTIAQALAIASVRAQISAVEDVLAADRNNLELVQIEFEAGKAARTDVLSAQSQLAADQALLPPLRQQLAIARHALTVLAGKSPAEWSAPDFDLASLSLPVDVPVAVPSDLVRARPDILAAESQLRAANAAVGIATANLYPSLTLSASWTREAGSARGLFNDATRVESLFGGLTAPIFHGGALQAQRAAATEAFAAASQVYRQTVLAAFGQVADLLRALQHDAELLAAQQNALETSQASLSLIQESYAAGRANLLQVLDAQRLCAQSRLGYVRAKAQRFSDTAQLFAAMGANWAGDLNEMR